MFKVTVYLPCSKMHVKARQFTNFEYKTLLKTFANKNYKECNSYIDNLLQSCIDTSIQHINFFDKLTLLLNLRCISINDMIVQTIKLETSIAKLNYSVYTIIEKLVNFTYPNFDDTCINKGKIAIVLQSPKNLFIDVSDLSNFIKSVRIGSKFYEIDHLPDSKRLEFVDNLPGVIATELYERIHNFKNELNTLELLQLRVDVDKKDVQPITLHIDQINMFTFINVLFNEHLSNLFLKQFILSKHHNVDCDYYDKMPPIESEIFFNFHKEIQEEEKKASTPTNNGPVIPGVIADSI